MTARWRTARSTRCASTRRLYDALERWASDDLRSINAQIEFLLRESLRRAGRLPAPSPGEDGPGE